MSDRLYRVKSLAFSEHPTMEDTYVAETPFGQIEVFCQPESEDPDAPLLWYWTNPDTGNVDGKGYQFRITAQRVAWGWYQTWATRGMEEVT